MAVEISNTGQPNRSASLGAHELGELPGVRHVDLVQRDEPGPVGQHAAERRGVAGELVLQRLHVRHGVAAGRERRAVDHVHQHRAPLDVPEEVQPQAMALEAPGISPGTSATVNTSSPAVTTPSCGTSVVNG